MPTNEPPAAETELRIPDRLRPALLPVAKRVFWWGEPQEWLDYPTRFAAQVMTYGHWDDVALVAKLLGEDLFRATLTAAPPGVFDVKSWTYWNLRYNGSVPPMPVRKLE